MRVQLTRKRPYTTTLHFVLAVRYGVRHIYPVSCHILLYRLTPYAGLCIGEVAYPGLLETLSRIDKALKLL